MPRSVTPEIKLVELAYELERDPQEWMREISSTLRKIVPGMIGCFVVDAECAGECFEIRRVWADSPVVMNEMNALFEQVPHDFLALFLGYPLRTGTTREVFAEAGIDVASTPVPDMFDAMGIVEQFGVAATSPSGPGAAFGLCLDNCEGPSPDARVMLTQIGAHLAAGVRLRRGLGGAAAVDRADAILQPDGKLEHATESSVGARKLLSEAVRRVEQARTRGCNAFEALELWQGLVDGTWSLVDHFESGGRRYYIAVKNGPQAAKSHALTQREAQVVAYLASGTGSKATAYALGLDMVTVRSHLHQAMRKLGLRNRTELVGLRATLLAATRSPPPKS